MTYVGFDLNDDPISIRDEIIALLQERWPDFDPSDSSLEKRLIDGWARTLAEVITLASDVPEAALKVFGAKLANVPPIDAQPAQANTTWTMIDNAGYTIPPEVVVLLPRTGSDRVAFKTVTSTTIPPGSTATAAGEVLLEAVDEGIAGNDITGVVPQLNDDLTEVESIALVGTTANGIEAETDEQFLDRLVEELRLLTLTPILPVDFEVLGRRVPGVFRIVAVDGWDPSDDSLDNERFIGFAGIDAEGDDLSAPIKTELEALFNELRETNFIAAAGDPTRTAINVEATVKLYPGFNEVTMAAAVEAAIASYLNPLMWGARAAGEEPNWANETFVRFLEIAEVINRADGVHYIESGTLLVNGATADVELDGVVALPLAGTIDITAEV